ncbi:DUF262 domain-containing protein [Kordia sp.]|uniref:DUF262 domain-containing protein n=1 Tax=Kordia sp. TaxID=1965332 RepID=UPI003D2E2078
MSDREQGSILKFFDLLSKENRIEIPIIQRDYAQGRLEQGEVRNNFLNALYDGIYSEIPLKLDFIYGSRVGENFQPLDGQQRLTTLFLLHWYALTKKENHEEGKNILLKFSYETRITSREFCTSLVQSDFKIDDEKKISEHIIDSKWFFLFWKKDPTIDAMLRTLDDIHLKFKDIDNLWDKLINEDLISFYYVELEGIGLTDDLYIKMNARGKLLSPFENFKASFEKKIVDEGWENTIEDEKSKFAFKIDTVWTDYFWSNYRKNNQIDDSLMRFMSTIVMIRLAFEKAETRSKDIETLHDHFNNLKPDFITEETYKYLYKCFTIYNEIADIKSLNVSFPFWRHKPKITNLSEIVYDDNPISYTQKIIFYAQTEYLINNKEFEDKEYKDWVRVVRNIVSRGNIQKGGKRTDITRSRDSFVGVINLIQELSVHSSNIYEFLSKFPKLNSSYARDQIEEEKIKSKLITSDHRYRDIIFKMEDCTLFKGRISFALDCISYDNNVDNFDFNLFERVLNVVKEHFNNSDEDKVSNDIRRALLTIDINGAYEFYNYWWSYWNPADATKRCLIENFRELEFIIYNTEEVSYFKKMILKLCEESVEKIINEFVPPANMPKWKVRLIKESKLLDTKAKSKFIAIPKDNSCCYLLASQRPRVLEGSVKII